LLAVSTAPNACLYKVDSAKKGIGAMTVFQHHIYEYKKGLRNLVLHTMSSDEILLVRRKLKRNNISYQVYPLDNGKMNVFFGAEECVAVVRAIGKRSLNEYTPEEDFILGTMLGYDRLLQCRRYLRFLDGKEAFTPPRGRTDLVEASLAAEREEACWDELATPCSGCETGEPCPACIARINEALESDEAVSA
jgi:hypothetical protein